MKTKTRIGRKAARSRSARTAIRTAGFAGAAAAAAAALLAAGCAGPKTAKEGERVVRDAAGGRVVATVPAIDDLPIAYEVRGRGNPALVFVHCWACNRNFWREQVDEFAKDHLVVTIDLAGHGESGKSRSAWSIEGLGADVRTVVETLDLSRVLLVGHSMGGPVCLEAARLLPGRVRGVIAVDTLHDADFLFPPEAMLALTARYEADYAGAMKELVGTMFPPGADPALVNWVVGEASAADRRATLELFKDFPNLDLPRMFREAGVPIRAINAAPTRAGVMPTSLEHNRKYADFDVTLIDGVGHYVQLEKPREFNAALKAAVRELD